LPTEWRLLLSDSRTVV